MYYLIPSQKTDPQWDDLTSLGKDEELKLGLGKVGEFMKIQEC